MHDKKPTTLHLQASAGQPALTVDLSPIRTAEARLVEAQHVNPMTYSNLEYVYGEGYRCAKRELSTIGYQIALAAKQQRKVRSEALLDEYKEFLADRGLKDSAAIRDAFLETKSDYIEAQDRIDQLRAIETLLEGKIKVFENVCRYMRKQMDIIIRSGVDATKYSR